MESNLAKTNMDQLPSLLENFSLLREKALSYIQQTSSATWTDHNVHDPGITIMEALCYALADVGFRMNFPMQDIIVDATGKMPEKSFYYPEEILPCHAVTIQDFRKLLIDLPLIKNAWITPVLSLEQGIRLDYDPMYVYKKDGVLLLNKDIQKLAIPQPEKDSLLVNAGIFLIGLYAISIEFESQPILGSIDSSESFQGVYEKDFFGDIYFDIGNWNKLLNDRFVLRHIADSFLANPKDVTITIQNSLKNKYNNNDGLLDDRVLLEWYYDLEIFCKGKIAFTFKEVLFQPFLAKAGGISGKDLKQLLTKNDFAFFNTTFQKIVALSKAYTDVYDLLNQNRNVCEDFLRQIAAVPTVEFRICADIDVDNSADIEQVQAELFHRIEEYISPSITFYSFNELIAKGKSIEEIVEGPLLKHGFILSAEMGENSFQNFTINLSDIINAVFEIPGLTNCRNVKLFLVDEDGLHIDSISQWEIKVPPGRKPVLNKRKSKFIFYKNELPLRPNFKESIIKLNFLNVNSVKNPDNRIPAPVLNPTYRDLALHFSIADEFPATYKIGRNFPDEFVNRPELFTSRQLEGYLLLFEQLIANFLSDLDHLKETLSWNPIQHTRYASDKNAWRRPYLLSKNVNPGWQHIVEGPDRFLEKRNASLDYLLSRFAEDLKEMDNFFYLSTDNVKINRREYFEYLIDLKQRFLSNYISISANRGAAVNMYAQNSYLDTAVSGYEERISHLIGCELMKNGKRKTTSDIDVSNKKERGYFHFLEHLMLRIPLLSDGVINNIQVHNIHTELLSICAEDDCTACGGEDPYSFTASFVLPAWLPVYADVHYRDFIEKLIRKETPAGVLLRICWIDEISMNEYEQKIENWWKARYDLYQSDVSNYMGQLVSFIDRQNQFILTLKGLRSEYFKATLHGCDDEGEENNSRIFLDRTFLGKP